MYKNIGLGQYIPGHSLLHRLDPRSKITGAIVFVIAAVIAEFPGEVIAVSIVSLVLILITRIESKHYFTSAKPLFYLIGLTALLQAFLIEGQVIISLYFISLTYEGLNKSFELFLRLFSIIMIIQALITTTSPLTLTAGLEKMLLPLGKLKMPVHELIMIMTIALRFIPLYAEEWERIKRAQISRGIDFKDPNIKKRLKNYLAILLPLFRISFNRALDLATAMESRCYQSGRKRTYLHELKMKKQDFFYLAFMGGVWLITAWL